MSPSRSSFAAAVLTASLTIAACTGSPEAAPEVEGVAAGASALAPSPGLARAIAASLEPRAGGVMPDGPARRRVADAAQALASAASVTLGSVVVLDDGAVVARALPGGHLQVSRGLLARCARRGARGSLACTGVLALLVSEVAEGAPEARLEAELRASGIAALPSGVTPLIAGEPGVEHTPALERAARAAGAALRACASERVGPLVGAPREQSALERAVAARCAAILESLGVAMPAALAAIADVLGDEAFVVDADGHLLRDARAGPNDGRTATVEGGALVRDLDLGPLPAEEAREAKLDAAAALLRSDDRAGVTQALGLADGPGARAAVIRARAQELAGQPREAERTLRTALVLDPGNHAARLALSRLYLAQDRRDAARAEAQAALERAPLAADAHLALGLAEDDHDRARTRLWIAAALEPDGPDGRRAAHALGALAPREAAPPPRPDPDRHRPLGGNR